MQSHRFSYREFNYYSCHQCGLVSTLPIPTAQQIRSHYEQKFESGNYELLRQYAPSYLAVYKDLGNKLHRYAKQVGVTLNRAKTLDIGTFTGEFMQVLHDDYGADVYGTELQAQAVAIANKRLPGKVFAADVLSTKLPVQKFNVISMLGLIEHVPNPHILIKKVSSLLLPNGIIMIQTPNAGSLMAKTMGKWWPPFAPIEHIHLFSHKSLRQLLQQNNLNQFHYQNHVKKLPINYVFQNFKNFGPEFHRLLSPLSPIISKLNFPLPFYGGEMVLLCRKGKI